MEKTLSRCSPTNSPLNYSLSLFLPQPQRLQNFNWLKGLCSPPSALGAGGRGTQRRAVRRPARGPRSPGGPCPGERGARGTHRGAGPERTRVLHLRGAAQRQRPEAQRHHAAAQDQLQQPERQQRASGQQRRARGGGGGCGGPAGGERGRRGQHPGCGGGGGAARPHGGRQGGPGPARPQREQRRLLGGGSRGARAPGLRPAREPSHRAAGAREHHRQGHGRAGKGAAGGGGRGRGAEPRAPRTGHRGRTPRPRGREGNERGPTTCCYRRHRRCPGSRRPHPPATGGPPPAGPGRALALTPTRPRRAAAAAFGAQPSPRRLPGGRERCPVPIV